MWPRRGEREETVLPGGTANRGRVSRIGATVRRPQTAASPSVHALLRHLESRGFEGAPRYLGKDSAGREVLSYSEGDVPIQPTPEWALTDGTLTSVANLLRAYHQAVSDFDPTPYRWATRVPARYRKGLVCHNDPNLDNVVFRDGQAICLIDFDLASPGSVEWDLASAARLWVPLQDPRDIPAQIVDRLEERLRLFADAYGLTAEARREMVRAVPATQQWSYDIVREGAQDGHSGYADYWHQAEERYVRGRSWLQANVDTLIRAVSRV